MMLVLILVVMEDGLVRQMNQEIQNNFIVS